LATSRTPITTVDVAIVTGLTVIDINDVVAATLVRNASSCAAVAIGVVTIIANLGSNDLTVATTLKLTRRRTTVKVRRVAIVATFTTRIVDKTVATSLIRVTSRSAGIAADVVTVVTNLAAVQDAVSTALKPTGGRAAITRLGASIITGFAGNRVDYAIAATLI